MGGKNNVQQAQGEQERHRVTGGHSHGIGLASAATRYRKRLLFVLLLTALYLVVEVVGGILTNSLALIADAGHMLTDVVGQGLALFAIWIAARPPTDERTYGYYRAEILGALTNAALLFAVAFYILFEAWQRFQHPPEVASGPMMIVAAVGLGVNIAGAMLLRSGAGESLNMRGAYLEVLSDTLGSLGVIVAGLIIALTGWTYADPLFSVAIGLFILPRTWRLLREAVGVLLEGTPAHLNRSVVAQAIEGVPGVQRVHDLHIWALTSGIELLTAHVVVAREADEAPILHAVNAMLGDQFKIDHTTLQVERADNDCEEQPF